MGARRVLEVGTLGGYSTIWLARAVGPQGQVVTVEIDDRHADVAMANFRHAGVADVIDLRRGNALDLLPALVGAEPFDLVFIDADKASIPEYFAFALRLTRPGSAIVVDNVARKGEVLDADSPDTSVQGVRRLVEALKGDGRVEATVIQTVGAKGYDGFLLARVGPTRA